MTKDQLEEYPGNHLDKPNLVEPVQNPTANQDQRSQLRLLDLFYWTTIAAGITYASTIHWLSSGGFVISLVLGLVATLVLVYYKRPVILFSVVATLSLFIGFLVAATMLYCFAIVGIFNWLNKESRVKFCFHASLFCVIVSLLVSNLFVPPRLERIMEGRKQFQIEDLSSRLKYETPGDADVDEQDRAQPSKDVMKNMVAFETWSTNQSGWRRTWQLEMIHSKAHERFVRSMGFGAARMISVRPESVATPPIPTIDFDGEQLLPNDGHHSNWHSLGVDRNLPVFVRNSDVNHHQNMLDFLHPETFGALLGPKSAAGFVPHAFHFPQRSPTHLDEQVWKLDSLQLVSLLKFNQPKVYVLDHLPRMDQLSAEDIQTRSLDEFETTALAELQTKSDLVVDASKEVARMLGSLRANTTCLDCHSVERGELLGAFTYTFNRNLSGTLDR